jgi:hypothetical protein
MPKAAHQVIVHKAGGLYVTQLSHGVIEDPNFLAALGRALEANRPAP